MKLQTTKTEADAETIRCHSDVYYVAFVDPNQVWQEAITSPIDSRTKVEKHADWLLSRNMHNVRVLKEV